MYICSSRVEKIIDHGMNCYETHIFNSQYYNFLVCFFG